MITEESAILVISTSLLGTLLFFLIKEAHFYARSLLLTSRCAIRGNVERPSAHENGTDMLEHSFRDFSEIAFWWKHPVMEPLTSFAQAESRARVRSGDKPIE